MADVTESPKTDLCFDNHEWINNLSIPAHDRDSWGFLCYQTKTSCPLYVLQNGNSYVIGKDWNRCNIIVREEDFDVGFNWVSRVHFSISRENLENGLEYVVLKNLSFNGTIINVANTRLTNEETCILEDGDIIWMATMTVNNYFTFKNKREGQIIPSLPLTLKMNFLSLKSLGHGAFGDVALVLDKRTNKSSAVKMTRAREENRNGTRNFDDLIQAGFNECMILHKINHPNIVKMYNFGEFNNILYMTMEYAPYGDLKGKLDKEKYLSEETNKHVFMQLLRALHYLHSNKIVHRDVKPQNVLMKTPGPKPHILLADFGLSRTMMHFKKLTAKGMFGTYGYMAPEIAKMGLGAPFADYNVKVDIWSFGITLFQCTFGMHPFESSSVETQLKRIVTHYFFTPSSIYGHTDVIKMISDSTEVNMDHRASAKQLLKSNWFVNVSAEFQQLLRGNRKRTATEVIFDIIDGIRKKLD